MIIKTPDPAPRPSGDRLEVAYAVFAADIAQILDLDAGARDATQPATYTSVTADLSMTLHLEDGLAAILGVQAYATSDVDAANRLPSPNLSGIIAWLTTLTALERLRMRVHPHFPRLCAALHRARDLGRSVTRDLEHARRLAPSSASVGDFVDALLQARDRAQTLARDLDYAVNHDLDNDRDRDLGLAVDLMDARGRARVLTRSLDSTVELAADYDPDIVTALDNNLALTRDLDHDLARARAFVLSRVCELAQASLGRDLDLSSELDQAELDSLLTLLSEAGDNFIGADLRSAEEVTVTDLTGVRWSLSTSWPWGLEDHVREASIEIEPGILKVVGNMDQRSRALVTA